MNLFETIRNESLSDLNNLIINLIKQKLWLQVIIGLIAGFGTGILLSPDIGLIKNQTAQTIAEWLALPGSLFLSLIQMIIIPLIFSSIIRGLAANENKSQLKQVGWRITIYFICTTIISITLGLTLAKVIEPGKYINIDAVMSQSQSGTLSQEMEEKVSRSDNDFSIKSLPEKITAVVPQNPFQAVFRGEMFQIVIFSLIVGIALINLESETSKPLLSLLKAIQRVCMQVVSWAMHLAPFAVFGLLAKAVIQSGLGVIMGLSAYVLTVLAGLLGIFLLYMTIIAVLKNVNPLKFISNIKEAMILGFSTSSSAAVMPLSVKIAEEKLQARSSIAQIIIPLGTTINMDGTALYQGVAAVFLAQAYNLNLGLENYIFIVITAVSASIGTPGAPGIGIIILAVIMKDFGIPSSGIGLLIGVDRILDMTRTMVNVTGDLTATAVMDKWQGNAPVEENSETVGNSEETEMPAREKQNDVNQQ